VTDDPPPSPALLPAGLSDLLPPDAENEAASVAALMEVFASHGYERVKPPLLEFEDGLFAGAGAATADQTFRLMDPESQRMMGLRADTTPQVARIASTRLAAAPRPLRLSYAGQCLRVRGNQLAPERQIGQAGIELIGPDSAAADAEIVLAGAAALGALGLNRASFDLTLPTLVPLLLEDAGIEGVQRQSLARALDRKDAAAVERLGGRLAPVLTELLTAAGPVDRALATLSAVELPAPARALAERLRAMVGVIRSRVQTLRLTVDPVEFRGFRYETGVSVTIFSPARNEELGRGGRYLCNDSEPATGLTLYPDAILRSCAPRPSRPRVFVPWATPDEAAARLRAQGFATVASLDPDPQDAVAEARRLNCSHVLRDGTALKLPAERPASTRG
jgi:ATP phosphoribosyltransferase regulatory subunit